MPFFFPHKFLWFFFFKGEFMGEMAETVWNVEELKGYHGGKWG